MTGGLWDIHGHAATHEVRGSEECNTNDPSCSAPPAARVWARTELTHLIAHYEQID
jgi:hypothetical protein